MGKSRLQIATPKIRRFFERQETRVFSTSDLLQRLKQQRTDWNLPVSTGPYKVIAHLQEKGDLNVLEFPFPYRPETRYVWGNASLLEIVQSLKTGGYFTHHTAAHLHGLTDQAPRATYLNYEQRPQYKSGELEQGRIDVAFQRPARISQNSIEFNGSQIILVNGMHTKQLGVIDFNYSEGIDRPASLRVTNMERTLIDIAVRPTYAGGTSSVLKAFRLARDRTSVLDLLHTYQALGYTYPYHQAIGFYLERAGYDPFSVARFAELPIEYNFYLAHAMGTTQYIKKWRLHIPADLDD